MVPPTTPALWLQQQAVPLLALLLGAVGLYLILKLSARSRARKLSRERDGVTEESFTRFLLRFGFDPVIAASTYRYLQEVQGVVFPILPSDRLDEDLGLDPADVQQTLHALSRALGRLLAPGRLTTPLITVEDLARALQAAPRLAAKAA